MVTYLVHVRLVVVARIIRLAIWIRAMLPTRLPWGLLLLMKHVRALVWLTRLPLTGQGGIRGGAAASLSITRLSIATKRLLLRVAWRVLRALVDTGCAERA